MKGILLGMAVAAGIAATPASARFERDAFTTGFDYDYEGFWIGYDCCYSANEIIEIACTYFDPSCTGSFANAVMIMNRAGYRIRKTGGYFYPT